MTVWAPLHAARGGDDLGDHAAAVPAGTTGTAGHGFE